MNLKKIPTYYRRVFRLLLCLPGSTEVPSFSQHQPVNDLEKNPQTPPNDNEGKCGVQNDLVANDDNESVATLPLYVEEPSPPYSAGQQCDALHNQRDAPIQPTNIQPERPRMNASVHGDVSPLGNANPSEPAISSPNMAGRPPPLSQPALSEPNNGNTGTKMMLQPETRPISQWQALIALHRTLLHQHYDFFLASQHPSASPRLRRWASKYAMPARMWKHGIHSFLELLRQRFPESLEHMLSFLYLAYSIMSLLYETVPAFEDTWIECLGDLGRYRMAIEDDDIRDREVWTGVSRHWYSKASDKSPTTGQGKKNDPR